MGRNSDLENWRRNTNEERHKRVEPGLRVAERLLDLVHVELCAIASRSVESKALCGYAPLCIVQEPCCCGIPRHDEYEDHTNDDRSAATNEEHYTPVGNRYMLGSADEIHEDTANNGSKTAGGGPDTN